MLLTTDADEIDNTKFQSSTVAVPPPTTTNNITGNKWNSYQMKNSFERNSYGNGIEQRRQSKYYCTVTVPTTAPQSVTSEEDISSNLILLLISCMTMT